MGDDPLASVRVAWERVPDGVARRDVAWALVRRLLPAATLTNPCSSCGGPHGAVRIGGAAAVASIGYAGDHAVVAVAPADAITTIGVDVELSAPARLERVLAPPAGLREWVRVEAVLKADGRGVRRDPGEVLIEDAAAGWIAHLRGRAPFFGRDVPGPPGALVSVAVAPG